jgi:general L-amino acid transport system substrate-binding protein
MRATQADKISSDVILPITLSLEPIAGAIKKDDKKFMLVVDWTIAAMIHAEEMGINSGNVDAFLAKVKADPGANPAAAKLLGVSGDYGGMLGVPKDWAYKVIKFVGNYGEVYERNLGKDSPYKLDRGLNKLWNSGGIIWAPVMD